MDMNDSFNPGRVDILGVGFDRLDMASLLVRVDADVSRGDRFTIAFSNPEFLMESRRSPLVRRYLSTVRYNLADGVGAVWAARRFGDALPERVTGTDFTMELAALCARRGHSLYLLGGAPGIADEAARRLRAGHPGLVIAGTHHGFFDDDGPVVADINRARPTFLMVCLGNPKQEAWIERNFAKLDVQVAFGNGGALDFHSGRVRRAPPWMMRLSLEWLHRLGQDLSWRRFRRQMRLVSFVALVMSSRLGVVVPSRRKAD
jgi:N-acetylglucosaminyldiphosphoundecaprenol N-acetyl-beta-D-mannosaminyltransferase